MISLGVADSLNCDLASDFEEVGTFLGVDLCKLCRDYALRCFDRQGQRGEGGVEHAWLFQDIDKLTLDPRQVAVKISIPQLLNRLDALRHDFPLVSCGRKNRIDKDR